MDVTAAMVHEAANEVQLGEHQVKRVRWPWVLGATAAVAVAALAVATLNDFSAPDDTVTAQAVETTVHLNEETAPDVINVPATEPDPVQLAPEQEIETVLDSSWLKNHQNMIWQGFAEIWLQPSAAFAIQAACNGDNTRGYACLRDQGSWSKIDQLGLPVVLVLQQESPSYLLLMGMSENRFLVGTKEQPLTISRGAVEPHWLGTYLVAWPQAPGWPAVVSPGDSGPAVATILEMAARVDVPYHGEQVFDADFEQWLKDFQARNGLEADGIVGRNTLLNLMTASIEDPQLLQTWEYQSRR